MMHFKNIFITANLAAHLATHLATHLAANSWKGGKLVQKINQYVVAIYLKSMLMTHVSAVNISH